MSGRSGHRFADQDMRLRMNPERVPIPQERGVLSAAAATFIRSLDVMECRSYQPAPIA